jgi:hypothetical protein
LAVKHFKDLFVGDFDHQRGSRRND